MGYPPQGSAGPSDLATVDANVDSILAISQRDRPAMVFPSAPVAKIIVSGTGADLTFPSVTVAGLPSGLTVARVDVVLVIGSTFDTSSAENQIKTGTTDELHVKANAAAWSAAIAALVFPALGLETGADAYGQGVPYFGAIDVKSVVVGNGTYNFQSDETAKTKGVEATANNLELHDVTTILRFWFN